MSDSEKSNGPNGAPHTTSWQTRDAHSVGEHCREIYDDARALTTAVRAATGDLQRYLTEQVEQRPYVTLGVAAGLGYLVGGGLRSRLTAVLLGGATRMAIALAAREIAARSSAVAFTPAQNQASAHTQEPERSRP